jgi:hypothetical protein
MQSHTHISVDMFVVICVNVTIDVTTEHLLQNSIYRMAYAQIVPINDRQQTQKKKTNDDMLSIDIIGLDSVSMNQFQRHATASWQLMNDMGM